MIKYDVHLISDHSSVRTASEGEEYSDNDATQEAT